MRRILFCTDWNKVDPEDVAIGPITLPDGSKHEIEMTYLHWYSLEFMMKRGHTVEGVAQDVIDAIQENSGDFRRFDECFRTAVYSYISERVKMEREHNII